MDKIFKGYYWHNYAKKRIDKKIPIKLLVEETNDTDWNTDKKVWRELKRNKIMDKINSSFVVFDNKLVIYTAKDDQLFGVYIQNEEQVLLFKQLFYHLWKECEK